MTERTFGWVQDPGSFPNLRRVVGVFCPNSPHHRGVLEKIGHLVEDAKTQKTLIDALSQRPLRISYRDLVGTAFAPRSSARCNGIIQAAVKGQRRNFISDWPADNFLRWGHALGFIRWDAATDLFYASESGLALSATQPYTVKEYDILSEGLLQYPPVARVLDLLANAACQNDMMTKFAIGAKLGFKGEKGFTSISESFFVREYVLAESADNKKKMRSNWEGDSDKYARMICGWLSALKYPWVRKGEKKFFVSGKSCQLPAYSLTRKGFEERKRTTGGSSSSLVPKFVPPQMLCTKGAGRELLRRRRALILRAINGKARSVNDIISTLMDNKVKCALSAIEDDLSGLENIGLPVEKQPDGRYRCQGRIIGLEIPKHKPSTDEEILQLMENCRKRLTSVPKEFVALVQMAFDSRNSLIFEIKLMELLTEHCGFAGRHLGGGSRPDGVASHEKFGVIIDAKSYAKGFSIPVSERDKMMRYIYEALNKPSDNKTRWWENFPPEIAQFLFLFVSGKFTGQFRAQLKSLGERTGVLGAAVSASTILVMADKLISRQMTHEKFGVKISCLDEVSID